MTAVRPPIDLDAFVADWSDWHRTQDVRLPCAYTDLARCPLPPTENRLPTAIEAGEKIPYERRT
jgi:uncharacterized protein